MMLPSKILKDIKRNCIHEAGHAVVAFDLGAPIKFVQMEIKFDGHKVSYSGLTEHDPMMFKKVVDGKEAFKSPDALLCWSMTW